MRVVVDVNVWISGFLWGGTLEEILKLVYENKLYSYVSIELLQELELTLRRPKFREKLSQKKQTVEGFVAIASSISTVLEAVEIEVAELRDPDDAKIIAIAVASDAEAIITGDLDLLVLQPFQCISILTPAQLLQKLR